MDTEKEAKKTKFNLKSIVGVVIGFFIASMGFNYLVKNSTVDEQLSKAASNLNKNLPMMVDSETRWDSTVALPDKTLKYFYTLVNYSKDELDINKTGNTIRPLMLNNIRTSSDMELFRRNKVTMIYSYRDKDHNEVMELKFTHDDYKE